MLDKSQIQTFIQTEFKRESWKALLAALFQQDKSRVEYFNPARPINISSKTSEYRAKALFLIGTITLDDNRTLNLYEVETQNTQIAENKVGLRNLVKNEIVPGFNDAALAVFHSSDQPEWRFSFLSKWEYPDEKSGKTVRHETHPKKFTYVLGAHESCRTARDRFYELQAKAKTLQSVVDAFSVSKLSFEFFEEYKKHYTALYKYLEDSKYRSSIFGIRKINDKVAYEKSLKPIRDFVKRLLGRIVFLYFLQKKGWIKSVWIKPGEIEIDKAFMNHLFANADSNKDFYQHYLIPLFFKTLNKQRKGDVFKIESQILGEIPYLNGGLFEADFEGCENIEFPKKLFADVFDFFNSYNFTIIEDSPEEREVAVDPEMLGHIFENLIEENKKFGTFYTPKEVVHFMTQEALYLYLSKKLAINDGDENKITSLKKFIQYKEFDSWIRQQASKIDSALDELKVCDPAIGSGAFPMGMLLEVYHLKLLLYAIIAPATKFVPAEVKEKIIRNSIYGVDIDRGAIDIARLRFWLSLIVDLDGPRPLPNLDYKFMQGDSLKEEFEGIPLSFDTKTPVTPTEKEVDLFGRPVDPQISLSEFIQQDSFVQELNLANLEDKLFNTYDEPEKQKIRKELLEIEKKYIRFRLKQELANAQLRLQNVKEELKRRLSGQTAALKKQIEVSYEKKIANAENEIDLIKEKSERLKTLDVYERPYFLWHLYFKHVFDRGGFDIVIANPPYGVPVDDEFYKKSALGSKDSYGFFTQLAIDNLLRPQGTLVFITSDTWLTITSHKKLRGLALKKQIHKVIRLHPDTFGAVVNTCIFSISNSSKSDNKILVADLTNLSTRKETPEFREKIMHLERFIGEANIRYAIYEYDQSLIGTNSNIPFFTANPKLFQLMNDMKAPIEKRILGEDDEQRDVTIRKLVFNGKPIETFRFNDLAEVNQGISTGQNDYYVRRISDGEGYKAVNEDLVLSEREIISLTEAEKLNGVDPTSYKGKHFIPFDKGGESETESGWLPSYYVSPKYYIDWSKSSLKRMRTLTIAKRKTQENKKDSIAKDDDKKLAAALRNQDKWFRPSINFSPTGLYSPTFRLGFGTIAQNTSSTIIVSNKYKTFALGILCSRLAKYIFKNFQNTTVHTQEGDVMEFPFINSFSEEIERLVQLVISKQKDHTTYEYFKNEQKEIDKIVYSLYGLTDDDIQEIEYWWARRYPKLARFADIKPRLANKDKQEQEARLREIIETGENKYVEFKSSLRLDLRKGTPEKYIEHSAMKTLAAYLNSEGGSLIVGVDDSKGVLGLEETDYKTFSKADKQDEWNKHLDNLLQNYFGNSVHALLTTQLVAFEGRTVAVINVRSSDKEMWLKNGGTDEFYIRRTASSVALSPKEAVEYINSKFGIHEIR